MGALREGRGESRTVSSSILPSLPLERRVLPLPGLPYSIGTSRYCSFFGTGPEGSCIPFFVGHFSQLRAPRRVEPFLSPPFSSPFSGFMRLAQIFPSTLLSPPSKAISSRVALDAQLESRRDVKPILFLSQRFPFVPRSQSSPPLVSCLAA